MKKIFLIILIIFVFPLFCFADFTDNGDGTITDNDTGLIWTQSNVITVDTDADEILDSAGPTTWENALSVCEGLVFAGVDDWRLPTVKELQSIVDYSRYAPTIDPVFTDTVSAYYWSSTSYVDYPDNAWAVYFYYGYVYGKPKTFEYHVRAVRGGQ